MRRLLIVVGSVFVAAVGVATACGDDEGDTGVVPTATATGQGGGGGAGGQALGIPRFGDERVLVGGQFRPTRLVLDGSHLYWTTRGGTAGGGAAASGGAGGAGGASGGAGAIGAGGAGGDGHIVILGAVVRVHKTGGTPTTVATAPGVTALAVDDPHVYFAVLEDEVGSIQVAPTEGGSSVTVLSGLGWPADVAVDADSIYWSELGTEGGLWFAPRPTVEFGAGGAGGTTMVAGGGGQGGGAAPEQIHSGSALLTFLRMDTDTLYFSDHGVVAHEGVIGAVDLQSKDTDLLVEGIDRPRYFAFDDSNIYVATEGDGRVQRLSKSGAGTPTVLAYEQDRPYGIAVDEQAVYWTNSATTPPAGGCEVANGAIMAMPIGGGEIVELASGQACPLAIAVDDTGLYWVNMGRDSEPSSGAIMRMPKR